MSRKIAYHDPAHEKQLVEVFAADEPGAGGACHHYKFDILNRDGAIIDRQVVAFQDGPIGKHGANGVTHEVLLAVLIDRLRSFQTGPDGRPGPYACRENALALTKLEEAVHWLNHRTHERVLRGVEGTSEK